MLKICDVFIFYIFHNCSNLNLCPTGASYQEIKESNNLDVRVMMAEIRPRVATIILLLSL